MKKYLLLIIFFGFSACDLFESKSENQIQELSVEEIISTANQSVYSIGINSNGKLIGIGTGFSISETQLLTNAHVIRAIEELIYAGGDSYEFVAVKNGSFLGDVDTKILENYRIHQLYDDSNSYSPDFGVFEFSQPTFNNYLKLASEKISSELQVGQTIHTVGFPGELNDLNTVQPLSTYKDGVVSSLRPFDPSLQISNNYSNVVIQHSAATTPGTSGSPIINSEGEVVGIHNSGIMLPIYTGNSIERVEKGDLSFGIRIDMMNGLFQSEEKMLSLAPVFSWEESRSEEERLLIGNYYRDSWTSTDGTYYAVDYLFYIDQLVFFVGFAPQDQVEFNSLQACSYSWYIENGSLNLYNKNCWVGDGTGGTESSFIKDVTSQGFSIFQGFEGNATWQYYPFLEKLN